MPLTVATYIALKKSSASLRLQKKKPDPDGLTLLSCRLQRIFLAVCIAAVPLAYIRLWLQNR